MLVFRIARAFSKRPNEVLGWDFYEEFLPASESLGIIPIVDELIKTIVDGLTRSTSNVSSGIQKAKFARPLETVEERQKAFEDMVRKQKEALENG